MLRAGNLRGLHGTKKDRSPFKTFNVNIYTNTLHDNGHDKDMHSLKRDRRFKQCIA